MYLKYIDDGKIPSRFEIQFLLHKASNLRVSYRTSKALHFFFRLWFLCEAEIEFIDFHCRSLFFFLLLLVKL